MRASRHLELAGARREWPWAIGSAPHDEHDRVVADAVAGRPRYETNAIVGVGAVSARCPSRGGALGMPAPTSKRGAAMARPRKTHRPLISDYLLRRSHLDRARRVPARRALLGRHLAGR